MNETLDMIQHISNERQMLYNLAGKQHLTSAQSQRLDEINAKLPVLWDAYRRELAGSYQQYTRQARRAA
ncbi:MAG: hypothetical protein K8L97_18595 [Anaerolineae bacterium]|nr:hypothetical protein [Anaerolineae bacterium]